jgi:hypothetical protein
MSGAPIEPREMPPLGVCLFVCTEKGTGDSTEKGTGSSTEGSTEKGTGNSTEKGKRLQPRPKRKGNGKGKVKKRNGSEKIPHLPAGKSAMKKGPGSNNKTLTWRADVIDRTVPIPKKETIPKALYHIPKYICFKCGRKGPVGQKTKFGLSAFLMMKEHMPHVPKLRCHPICRSCYDHPDEAPPMPAEPE